MISLIAAHDINRGIGKDNKIPWHIPEDFMHFKEVTMGHPVIMGRKTFESIGKPLPGRENIVITRDTSYSCGAKVVHSLDEAISFAQSLGDPEVFIIGGSEIYTQALSLADKLYITLINEEFTVDSYFPDYTTQFKKTSEERMDNGDYYYYFQTYEKKPS